MARPQTISDDQILKAAHDVFLDKGYSATTAEIARRAGVSEGTVFRRFASKDVLFVAALGFNREPEVFVAIDDLTTQDAPFDERLGNLSRLLLDFYEKLVPAMSCLKASPISLLRALERENREPTPARAIRKIETFFQTAVDKGEIRNVDVAVITRVFMGTLHGYAFQAAIGINRYVPLDRSRLERGLLEMIKTATKEPE